MTEAAAVPLESQGCSLEPDEVRLNWISALQMV